MPTERGSIFAGRGIVLLIRLTAAAMLTTFVATSVPTASFADNAECGKLVRDLQKTLGDRRSSDRVDRLEDILDDMEDECDVITLLESARKFGKFRKSKKIPGTKIPGTMTF